MPRFNSRKASEEALTNIASAKVQIHTIRIGIE
jgi:hypothetical protein